MKKSLFVIFLLLCITGCQAQTEPIILKQITLSEAYPGDILEVNKIELLDGSSGERKIIKNQAEIQSWIKLIKDIELTPDENQEGRTGFIFGISLINGDDKIFGFGPHQMNKIYYKNNPEFEGHIRVFFEDQFGREF
ncbi:hypothetical protein J2T13_002336 [Paenibacillus sp. DS2015]|uniref:hypothetical protein n=1 Tax=Paenibacillus sp. DS2015 TaxID=3373917 RepID=UPI003D1E309D